MRYVMKIAYDGTVYAGWQRQKNAISVQEVVENAIYTALGVTLHVTASGRTDAGVHAAGQVCHFDGNTLTVPPERMPDCLNRFLPPDVRIVDGWGADVNFDSNRSAKRKTYCYSLYVSKREMPIKERFAVRIDDAPDLAQLQTAAKLFECRDAIENGADEIDTVINVGHLKSGRYDEILTELTQLKQTCGNRILKVIIETCLLTDEEKIKMCEIVTASGADFIKTSTGFSTAGATKEDVALFAKHIGAGVQIKAAGGISSLEDAEDFIKLGATRLGTSRIVKIAKNESSNSTY